MPALAAFFLRAVLVRLGAFEPDLVPDLVLDLDFPDLGFLALAI